MSNVSKGAEAEPREASIMPRFSRFPLSVFEGIEDLFSERFLAPWWGLRAEDLLRAPPLDVYEDGEDVVVKADLPGMKKGEVEVSLVEDLLTISGKKTKEEKIDRKDYRRYERSEGSFSRTVRLPSEVDSKRMTARLQDGVLEVRAPKTSAGKAKVRVDVT